MPTRRMPRQRTRVAVDEDETWSVTSRVVGPLFETVHPRDRELRDRRVGDPGVETTPASTHGGERLSLGSMERDGLALTVDSQGLTLRALDYHCPPQHIRREDLQRLGFVLLTVGRRLQPSAALARQHHGGRWKGSGSSLPEGLVLDGFVIARVRAGLDIFVTSYRAQALRVGPDELRRVGLRLRKQSSGKSRVVARARSTKDGDA